MLLWVVPDRCWRLMWDGTQGHPASAYSLERYSSVAFQIDSFRTWQISEKPRFCLPCGATQSRPSLTAACRFPDLSILESFLTDDGFSLLTHFDLATLCTHDSVGSLFIGVYIGASRLPTLLPFLVFYGTTAMCLFFPICLFYFSYRFSIFKNTQKQNLHFVSLSPCVIGLYLFLFVIIFFFHL